MDERLTLDAWLHKYAPDLRDEVRVLIACNDVIDTLGLERSILQGVRNWYQARLDKKEITETKGS